jgi:dTDP-L-rhamnose 4-epimerase
MKVLLLGGAGFIGSQTALRLLTAGHQVVVLDSFLPQIHGRDLTRSGSAASLFGRVELIAGDVVELPQRPEVWENVDRILYLAAATGTGQSMYDIQSYCRTNVQGAAVIAELLQKSQGRIQRVVVSSTRAVYGEGAWICPDHHRVFPGIRRADQLNAGHFEAGCPVCGREALPVASLETDATHPTSVYGITKLAQEQLILSTCASAGIPAVAFRYQNVFGPGQSLRNPYTGILSIFTQLIRAGAEINVFEDGLASRDFVYIDDVAEYNFRALTQPLTGTHVLNLGTGQRQTILDVVQAVAETLGQSPKFRISGQFRAGDIRHAAADIRRLTATLGPRDMVSFSEGVRRLTEWALGQEVDVTAPDRYHSSLNELRTLGLFGQAGAGLKQ